MPDAGPSPSASAARWITIEPRARDREGISGPQESQHAQALHPRMDQGVNRRPSLPARTSSGGGQKVPAQAGASSTELTQTI
jgi:hypothetical protein